MSDNGKYKAFQGQLGCILSQQVNTQSLLDIFSFLRSVWLFVAVPLHCILSVDSFLLFILWKREIEREIPNFFFVRRSVLMWRKDSKIFFVWNKSYLSSLEVSGISPFSLYVHIRYTVDWQILCLVRLEVITLKGIDFTRHAISSLTVEIVALVKSYVFLVKKTITPMK